MIFKDERNLWYADKELLATLLANKSETEIMEYIEYRDIVQIRSEERPTVNTLGRLLYIPTCMLLIVICGVKWVLTGSFKLDSWCKKFKVFDKVMKYTGIV